MPAGDFGLVRMLRGFLPVKRRQRYVGELSQARSASTETVENTRGVARGRFPKVAIGMLKCTLFHRYTLTRVEKSGNIQERGNSSRHSLSALRDPVGSEQALSAYSETLIQKP